MPSSEKKNKSSSVKSKTGQASKKVKKHPPTVSQSKNAVPQKPISSVPPKGAVQRPSSTLILIWVLVLAELVMDFVTTVISFISAMAHFECCGVTIDFRGSLVLGFTIPFFLLILLELGVLAVSIKQGLYGATQDNNCNTESAFAFLGTSTKQRWINGLLLLNPFLGFLMAWMLLYQADRRECLMVLGLEAASLALHYSTIYLEGHKQTRLSIAIYSLPLIPFAVTVIVVVVYLNRGGVCYLVDEEIFWYEGCQICSNGTIPDEKTGRCPDGTNSFYGDYCEDIGSFCWFDYS